MIGVTERAKAELRGILTSHVDHPQACLRLTVNEQEQLGLGIDIEMPEDEVVEYEGSKLLVVTRELATQLEGTVIDVEDREDGAHLVIANESAPEQ